MKVAIIIRPTSFTVKGGDTIQAVNTARELVRAGISAHIERADSFIDYARYDLLHFFNLTRPADLLPHISKATIPFILSPIWIDYSIYDKNYRKGFAGILFRFLSSNKIEYLKNIARWIGHKELLSHFTYIRKGQKRSIQHILNKAALLLPNSAIEYNRLAENYPDLPQHITVPNGIDTALFIDRKNVIRDQYLVLCVARIEGIKNQLNLIKALNNTAYKLLLIGSPAPNQLSYYRECRKAAADNISFIDHLPQEELVHYYQQARVHVLPSWFETCGLSSLEAAAMGCNIVVTDKGYTKEYYEDHAFYCDPISPSSIRQAIENAARAPFPEALKDKIFTHYTWQKAAEKTLTAYRQVLQQR